jgi:hypothetical protein
MILAAKAPTRRFGSDMWYDYINDKTYLVSDRGPGGGVISYSMRWHAATLGVSRTTGEIECVLELTNARAAVA